MMKEVAEVHKTLRNKHHYLNCSAYVVKNWVSEGIE